MEDDLTDWRCQSCGDCTTNLCSGCNKAAFCSPFCLIRARHEYECQRAVSETIIKRAGQLTQSVFFMIREKFYTIPLERFERIDGCWTMRTYNIPDPQRTVICPFPPLARLVDDEWEEVALCMGSGSASMVWTWSILNKLLVNTGFFYGLEVLDLKMDGQCAIVPMNGANAAVRHQAYVFGRRSNAVHTDDDRFVVDLTGCQYGFTDGPVKPHDDYLSDNYAKILRTKRWPYPCFKPGADEDMPTWFSFGSYNEGVEMSGFEAAYECSIHIDELVQKFKYEGVSLAGAVRANDAVWRVVSDAFLDKVQGTIDAFYDFLHSKEGPLVKDGMGLSVLKKEGESVKCAEPKESPQSNSSDSSDSPEMEVTSVFKEVGLGSRDKEIEVGNPVGLGIRVS